LRVCHGLKSTGRGFFSLQGAYYGGCYEPGCPGHRGGQPQWHRIGPGWIHTGSSSEEELSAGTQTPVGRSGTPEEVGHVAVFLASEEASYVTGQLIVVDGGNTIQEYKVALP